MPEQSLKQYARLVFPTPGGGESVLTVREQDAAELVKTLSNLAEDLLDVRYGFEHPVNGDTGVRGPVSMSEDTVDFPLLIQDLVDGKLPPVPADF